MHEIERHRIILSRRPAKSRWSTVSELVELTGASEATIRRDIARAACQDRLRRVRGGAEAIHPPQLVGLAGRPFSVNEDSQRSTRSGPSRASRGGALRGRRADHHQWRHHHLPDGPSPGRAAACRSSPIRSRSPSICCSNSKNTIMLPGGTIYREQNIILSPVRQ